MAGLPDAPFRRLEVVASPGSARVKHLENYPERFRLREGEPLAGTFPAEAAYRMNPDFRDDIGLEDALFNLDHQLVVSERLRAFLAERVGPDVEFLPVTLFNHKRRAVREPYAIANLLRHVDAVDRDATTFSWNELDPTLMTNVRSLTVDPARVPPEAVLFRLAHLTSVIVARRDLAEAVAAEGFTGVGFADFASYRG